jgi:hypothetical protein
MILNYKEKVALMSDYIDEFNHQYKKGQTGVIGNPIDAEDKKVMILFDGYEAEKQRTEKMQEKMGEGPNIVEYLSDIPINILIKA